MALQNQGAAVQLSYADAIRPCYDVPQQVWVTSRIAPPTDGLAIR